MNTQEFSKIAKAIKTYYPNMLEDEYAIELWYEELKDLDYNTTGIALRKHVQTSPYPPTIADIRRQADEITSKPLDWGEGWELVRTAMSKFGSYDPQGAMKYLEEQDPVAHKIVKRIGFVKMCRSENEATERAAFRDMYQVEAKREKAERQMSPKLREYVKKAIGGEDDEVQKIESK